MQPTTKKIHYNKARKIGGSTVVSIPPEILEKLGIEEGDEIAFQKENSDKHGDYASFWNQDKQKEQ